MYEDINGDGKVDDGDGTIDNPGDLTVIGNSEARYRIGINLYLSWRGLDCSMFWQGVLKQDFRQGRTMPRSMVLWEKVSGGRRHWNSIWIISEMMQRIRLA